MRRRRGRKGERRTNGRRAGRIGGKEEAEFIF